MMMTDQKMLMAQWNLKNIPVIFLVSVFLLFGMGCGSNKTDVAETDTLPEPTLQLNNGEKWEANIETTEGINNMILLLSEWQEQETDADYTVLKSNLESEFKLIFKKCTMTGEAHDQLHNYLMPLKDLIDRLETDAPNDANTTMADLEDHLQLYFEYFE